VAAVALAKERRFDVYIVDYRLPEIIMFLKG
jgi:hypothetical protein